MMRIYIVLMVLFFSLLKINATEIHADLYEPRSHDRTQKLNKLASNTKLSPELRCRFAKKVSSGLSDTMRATVEKRLESLDQESLYIILNRPKYYSIPSCLEELLSQAFLKNQNHTDSLYCYLDTSGYIYTVIKEIQKKMNSSFYEKLDYPRGRQHNFDVMIPLNEMITSSMPFRESLHSKIYWYQDDLRFFDSQKKYISFENFCLTYHYLPEKIKGIHVSIPEIKSQFCYQLRTIVPRIDTREPGKSTLKDGYAIYQDNVVLDEDGYILDVRPSPYIKSGKNACAPDSFVVHFTFSCDVNLSKNNSKNDYRLHSWMTDTPKVIISNDPDIVRIYDYQFALVVGSFMERIICKEKSGFSLRQDINLECLFFRKGRIADGESQILDSPSFFLSFRIKLYFDDHYQLKESQIINEKLFFPQYYKPY